MPATNQNEIRADEFLLLMIKSIRHIRNAPRSLRLLSIFLALALMLGCAPPSNQEPSASGSSDFPEITEEMIYERINDTWIRKVPEENSSADPISWSFDENEPKEIRVVEKQVDGAHAIIVLDITTRSAPHTRNPRSLAGQIRTEWKLETGWALRRWEIINTENISMKYKNLPKSPEENSDR